ncbi:MAG: RAMP superfamily protein [Deltaproteobacteria bacterium ADurb.BinA179]|jgi:CRISPR-associated protein Csm5|nr:MAG: RAMP superfamily protein [Deltaproteobacteria bacterium ADurb.BinA179]HOD70751.1 type III-A CRISPR-associated RAMP protein Csm5 [Deltaproteobacteria bacterium]HQM20941.1 type III-A CRISPR-associated RAMP protein Csm5 [Deltaproteobacteria bacterium]HRC99183.1 type III-A CRISPR-associated RAMP protein Csm5 [Deltaproteobacteria bacterium]
MPDENIRFHIRTVAPIHIGCDDSYEPMGFVVDEQNKFLCTFDPLDFIRTLPPADKIRFSAICAKGTIESLLELYKFMRVRKHPGRKIRLCEGFLTHYAETMQLPATDRRKIQQELNRFAIARTAFNPNTGQPYIPGSSIKGALRTAWLNKVQGERPARKDDRLKPKDQAKDLEKKLLDGGNFATDPLRMLKISDFMPVGDVKTMIVYAVNEKKKLSKFGARGLYQILEVIEPGSMFEGVITVNKPLHDDLIENPLEIRSLIAAAMRFYGQEIQRENRELEHIGINGVHPEIPSSGFLLRIGRHSGAESVTVAGHRSIRIMRGKDKPAINLDHATTFWLSADDRKPTDRNMHPFGWLTVVPGPAPETAYAPEEEEPLEVSAPTAAPKPPVPEKTAAEKLLDELALIKPDDKGRLGTIIQNIETLPDAQDKAAIARAIRDKLGTKGYKKFKRRDYLDGLLANAGSDDKD